MGFPSKYDDSSATIPPFPARSTHRARIAILASAASLVLISCAAADPFGDMEGDSGTQSGAIVVGSQDYYSNEIIAEIYAQALEAQGLSVDRQLRIGRGD